MIVFYLIPELIIIALIFGVWKMAYEARKKQIYDNSQEFQSATGVLWLAAIISVLGVSGLLGIATIMENYH